MMRFLLGAILTFLVMIALMNIQTFSDMVPQELQDATAPGIGGLVVAIVGGLWLVAVPVGFIRQYLRQVMAQQGVLPQVNFKSGGILGLAAWCAYAFLNGQMPAGVLG